MSRELAKEEPKLIRCYKMTRADGTDFYTGTVNYAAALASQMPLVHPDPAPVNGRVCGRGYHVSDTARKTTQFGERQYQPYRWFEVAVDPTHVIESDDVKLRVSQLIVVKEIGLADIFGPDLRSRIERVIAEMPTWKQIPWLKPPRPVTSGEIEQLFAVWHAAITLWLKNGCTLPKRCRMIRDCTVDAAAAAIDAAAVAAIDAAVAAVAAAAIDAVDDAAAAINAAAAVDDAVDDAAAAVDDVVAAVAVAAEKIFHNQWFYHWYIRPCYVLLQHARWIIAGMAQPSPWTPLVDLYRLGCIPLGYVKGEFVVYVPETRE